MSLYKYKKVVVTGGSGFVGTHFIQELLNRGANVRTSIHNNPLKIQDDRIEVLENIDLTKFDDVMNDQRQVIFSQRMKILKEVNINGILEDFFNEILQLLNNSRINYQKSHDEKSYLTELKNITGNSVSDSQLLEYGKLEESKFNEKIKELYLNKKKSRVEILGEDQNNSLEKKIFLQIIDFSWRSHLQYLEQLRQVIGLRQYGQKDPLSEFKKEAFVLFEGLLTKIKNDLIKFLLNLNIVFSDKEEEKEKNVEKKLNKKGKIKRW